MDSHERVTSIKARRIARQFDELEAILKTLPPDRIQALEGELMGTPGRDRQARYADKQSRLGRIRPNWWIDADIVDKIRQRADALEGSRQDAVNAVLRELLEQTGHNS